MIKTSKGSRAARPARRASALLALVAASSLAAAAPALGQAVTVIGDAGGEACYRAASSGLSTASALEDCDRALEHGSLRRRNLAATHLNRGIILGARGDLDGAMADYQAARRIAPDLPESYVGEGNVLFLAGDFNGALEAYETALAEGLTRRHIAHFNRGLAFEQQGRWDEAEAAYLEAAADSPGWGVPARYLERLERKRAEADE